MKKKKTKKSLIFTKIDKSVCNDRITSLKRDYERWKYEEIMKIKLYFEKENLIRLAVAVVFAAVLFAVIRFPVWVLFGFGVLYFGIKSLKIELNEKLSWLWSAIMLGTGGILQHIISSICYWMQN